MEQRKHLSVQEHTQHPERLNVCEVIISGDQVSGSLFFNVNLNSEASLGVLENTINLLIIDALENQLNRDGNILLDEDELHSQR